MLRNILYIVLLCFFMIDAATYTVAKDGTGQFDNIRAALNHVEANDVILILDKAEYNSRVFIDGSHDDSYDGITLKSADPTASEKPAIVWNDRSNVYPDLQHEHTVNYDENGALCLKEVKNVTIEGIRIDGNSDEEGYFIFGENDIWGAEAHLQHGNGALAMKDCYGITVRNCDIGNAYIGINIKGRNEGGIYANANPHDVEPWDVVPLSGFGKSGHHIFEYNRIHNNSFGMYFESIWDLGSIIRYNLFYENHHASDSLAEEVYNLTAEGPNQPGGVIMGKDHMLSPIAVYNNTFWHNASILIGNWRQGRQHLFFNNIVSSPYRYLDDDPVFLYGSGNSNTPVSDLHMEQTYANRINNSVYAAQAYDPSSQDPVLIYEDVEVDGASQGALISTYPGRDVRWLETESLFQSTDPASSSFLEPDWSNSDVQTYIVDQGWEDMDIRDPDGSPADLGAYSEGGGQIRDVAVITPLAPVKVDEVDGNTIATVVFDLSLRGEGNFVNPELQYVRFLRNIEFEQNAFGARSGTSIQESDLVEMDITDKSVEMGYNELEFQIQERDTSEIYAFFEMSIQGTGANGNTVTSGVGFPLYRRLDFVLDVTVIDESGELVSEIDVGEEYFLHIEAYDIDGTYYSDTLTKNNVTLDSDGPFYSRLEEESKTPMNIREIYQVFESECYFTKVPENKRDIVKVTALWQHPSLEGYYRSFYGISQSLEINPGPPAEIEFVNPPSVSEGVDPYKLDYGDTLGCAVQVTDEFGNKVDESVGLQLETTDPFIGDIEGAMEGVIDVTTDTSGRAEFNSFITYGATGQEYSLIATASNYGFSDTAVVSVNSSLDHLWIFYDDAGNYDEGAEIRDTSGNRVPVIIWASKDGTSPLLHRDSVLVEITDLTVNAVDSTESIDYDAIDFYASENAEDTLIDNRFMLMSGMDTVWISSEYPVENGKIRVEAVEDSSIVSGGYAERGNIYFEYPPVAIDSANFYSDNSTGTVDRVVIHYAEKLDSLPDSISVYWPGTNEQYIRKIYPGVENDDGDAVLSDDSMSITVNLENPFTEGKTDALDPESLSGPGADSWVSPFEDIGFPPLQSTGPGLDRTGPILRSATIVERFEPGADSLTVRLSESIDLSSLSEGSMVFTLIKRETGDTIRLDMVEADSLGRTQYRFLIPDKGDSSPVEYDSLKLDPLGDVKDLRGTGPDPENPLVGIQAKGSKMPIEHAYYTDHNADGMVDRLIMRFNTEVKTSSFFEVSADWEGYTGSVSMWHGGEVLPLIRVDSITDDAEECLLAMIDFQTVYDSATMTRELVHVFTNEGTGVSSRDSIDIRDYNLFGVTTGSMEVTTAQNIELDTAYVSAIAHDSAAPVLMSAVYRWGGLIEDGVWAADTLVAEFSEEIRESELKEYPLNFKHPNADSSAQDGEYDIGLEYHSHSGTRVTFVVDTGSKPPWDMDSVWINPEGGVMDLQNNTQDNEENIKTNIRIEGLKPHTLTCMVLNPFTGDPIPEEILDGAGIGDFEGTFIEIRPGEGVKSRDVSLRITGVQIVDLVGNAVIDAQAGSSGSSVNTDHIKSFQIKEGELDGRAYILWDTKNSNGRDVAPGGYIVYVEAMRGDERYIPGADRSGPLMFQIKRP